MRKIIYYTLLILFIIIFLVSAVLIINYLVSSKEQSDFYDGLASIRQENQAARPPIGSKDETTPDDPDDSTEPTEPQILDEFQPLYEMNSDLVGWIEIPGTKVNYPVVQTTPDNRDYYLYKNFEKQKASGGCLYVREECDVFRPSDNVTIYGHNMRDGSMFGQFYYYQQEDFYQDHRYIYFDTLYERHTYEIFAVFKTTASVGEGFKYHMFIDAMDEEEYYEFVDECIELSFYNTGVIPQYGDKIICLSTCEYSLVNGRLVVAAVRID